MFEMHVSTVSLLITVTVMLQHDFGMSISSCALGLCCVLPTICGMRASLRSTRLPNNRTFFYTWPGSEHIRMALNLCDCHLPGQRQDKGHTLTLS